MPLAGSVLAHARDALHFQCFGQRGALAQKSDTMNETERYSKPEFELEELVVEQAILEGTTEGGEEGESY